MYIYYINNVYIIYIYIYMCVCVRHLWDDQQIPKDDAHWSYCS